MAESQDQYEQTFDQRHYQVTSSELSRSQDTAIYNSERHFNFHP